MTTTRYKHYFSPQFVNLGEILELHWDIPVLGSPAFGQSIVATFRGSEGRIVNVANGTTLRRFLKEYRLELRDDSEVRREYSYISEEGEYPFLFELKGENARYDANYFFNGSRFRVVALPGDRVVMGGM